MVSRRASSVTGLFATPVTPVTARPAHGDPVTDELAGLVRGLKQVSMVKAVKQLVTDEPAPATAGGMPAAQSVGEVVKATVESATAVAALHKGAAETAMAQARIAKEEAKEAKEEASGAYGAGLEEGRTQMAQLMTVIQEGHKNTLELVKQLGDAKVQSIEAQARDSIERITATAQQAIAAKDQQIQTLTQRLESLSGRKTLEEEFVAHFLGKTESPIIKFLQAQSQPAAADPNAIFQAHLAPHLATLEVERRKRDLERADTDQQRKDAITRSAIGLVNDLGSLIKTPGALAGLFGLGGTAAPQPGFVPNTFDGGGQTPPAAAAMVVP